MVSEWQKAQVKVVTGGGGLSRGERCRRFDRDGGDVPSREARDAVAFRVWFDAPRLNLRVSESAEYA